MDGVDQETSSSAVGAATTQPKRTRAARLCRIAIGLPALALIGLLRLYQRTLSPLLGPTCRFSPSCSEYWIGAVARYGVIRGVFKGVGRLARCHPFHPGGYDPP